MIDQKTEALIQKNRPDEDDQDFFEDYNFCYECTGYGDDYYYDADLDDLVCACDDCPHNENNWEDGYWRDDV